MRFLRAMLEMFIPRVMIDGIDSEGRKHRYHRLWTSLVLLTALAALLPLLVLALVNYYQYQQAFRQERSFGIFRQVARTEWSLENFIKERESGLLLIVHEKIFAQLCDEAELTRLLANLKRAFGRFVDLGVIDAAGKQRAYVGPYELQGKNYQDQQWFHEVTRQGIYVSEVFLGLRQAPHFVIAVKHQPSPAAAGEFYVLRATFDTQMLAEHIAALDLPDSSDAFVVNHQGVLQTPSRAHGGILEKCALDFLPRDLAGQAPVTEVTDAAGRGYLLGCARIKHSPFIFTVIERRGGLAGHWVELRNRLIGFTVISALLVVMVSLWSATYAVNRLRRSDLRQAEFLANIQYTNKMASIGRLAAGVAHEVNNPLAIINEKAGLLQDLANFKDDFTYKEKTLEVVKSILKSVQRCSTITHRLLGFAKRVEVRVEPIALESMMREVLSYLGKEAEYRNIAVAFHVAEDLPRIESDNGQLQQVFLNIINNAFSAMENGGRLNIFMRREGDHNVALVIQDTGQGMSRETMKNIFEPFFTTKKEYGTGLGLSITYGIVQKLGGSISVESELGQGSRFTVVLPRRSPQPPTEGVAPDEGAAC